MRAKLTSLSLMILTAAAVAQQPAKQGKQAQPDKTYTSAKEVVAMMAKAKSERKQDQANFIQTLLRLAPYSANLEYRGVVGPAATHEKEAELFYVIDGGGTMVTGGKLTKESRTNAENLTGSGIEGGTPRKLAKGDFLVVPENTPHWFSSLDGSITLMSLHVPRSSGGTR